MIPLTLHQVARDVSGTLAQGADPAVRIAGVSTDTRTLDVGDLFVPLVAGRDGHAFLCEAFARGASATLAQRGRGPLPAGFPAVLVRDTKRALLDIAGGVRRRLRSRVVAVTGSCGKTTTKEMLWAILSAQGPTVASPKSFNNAIGVPLTLCSADISTRFLVAEIGASAPGEIGLLAGVTRPHVAVLTMVGEAHLAGFGSLAAVFREKGAIWKRLEPGGTAVYNADQVSPREVRRFWKGRALSFGLDPVRSPDLLARDLRLGPGGSAFRVEGVRFRIPLAGAHNVANTLAALAAARALGMAVSGRRCVRALSRIPPPPGRMRRRLAGGVEVWDDTYNANPSSVRAALETLALADAPGRTWIVLGDMLELGRRSGAMHRRVGELAASRPGALFWGVGRRMRRAVRAAADAGMRLRDVRWFPDAGAAAFALKGLTRSGDRVLVKGSREMRMERIVEALIG